MSVWDITPLLSSHLYKSHDQESRGKILVPREYITKFNPSIVKFGQLKHLYLMTYRYVITLKEDEKKANGRPETWQRNTAHFKRVFLDVRDEDIQINSLLYSLLEIVRKNIPSSFINDKIKSEKSSRVITFDNFWKNNRNSQLENLTTLLFLYIFSSDSYDESYDELYTYYILHKSKELYDIHKLITEYVSKILTVISDKSKDFIFAIVTLMSNKNIAWLQNDFNVYLTMVLNHTWQKGKTIKILQQWNFVHHIMNGSYASDKNPNHPWATLWEYDHAGTGFVMIDWEKKTILHEWLYVEFSSSPDGRSFQPNPSLEDVRIFQADKVNQFHLTCQNQNHSMNVYTLTVDLQQWKIYLSEGTQLCDNLPTKQRNGKNWSEFVMKDGHLAFSHKFLPHRVLIVTDNEKWHCKIAEIAPPIPNIDELYLFNSTYHFALGTPAIQYNDVEMIAIGHSRFNIDDEEKQWGMPSGSGARGESPMNTKSFISFKKRLSDLYPEKSLNLHPIFYYFMFIYTFDANTLQIRRMSHSILPPNNYPYVLAFAAGITKINSDEFLIAYGEGDARVKLLTWERSNIESFLVPIENMIHDKEKHGFLIIDELNRMKGNKRRGHDLSDLKLKRRMSITRS